MADRFIQQSKPVKPEPILISELQINTEVRGWLLVADIHNRTTKNSRPFRQLRLRDQRGNEITVCQFDLPPRETRAPQKGKVVLLEGVVGEYHHEIQIKLTRAELDETAPPDLFVVGTRRKINHLEVQFWELKNKIQHPGLQALLCACFTVEVMERFRRWPAAVHHHGAVVGGLLEHTVNVALIAEQLTQLYPCNRELVLTGTLLHDLGKLEELEEQAGIGFTPSGNLFGHIVLSARYMQAQARQVSGLDESTGQDLLHIILAHHGTKEFGSPVCPATIEALIVHLADMTEAKLTGFLDHCDRTSTANGWSTFSKEFGGSLRMPYIAE